MSDRTYHPRERLPRTAAPNNSCLPRGFGLSYIWIRLRVYLAMVAFVATVFAAVAAAMAGLGGWLVLVALFWIAIAYLLLPARLGVRVNAKLDNLLKAQHLIVLDRLQTQPALVIILIVGGLLAGALLGWGAANMRMM